MAGGAGKGMADVLSGIVDIAAVSREIYPDEKNRGACHFPVAIDAVIPTANSANPVISALLKKGIKREQIRSLWITGNPKTWGGLAGTSDNTAINLYTRSDSCGAAETWAGFILNKQEDLKGTGVYGDPGIVEAVKKDPSGMGYNNVNFAYDASTKRPVAGIFVVPVDFNGNGIIDKNENFYNSRDELMSAISSGKFPFPPARRLYFVTKGKPAKKELKEFIRWVLTHGRSFVDETGYINIPEKDSRNELKRL
jgi:phosphate transport system substrate-binding protein